MEKCTSLCLRRNCPSSMSYAHPGHNPCFFLLHIIMPPVPISHREVGFWALGNFMALVRPIKNDEPVTFGSAGMKLCGKPGRYVASLANHEH